MIMPTFDFIPKKKYEYIDDGTTQVFLTIYISVPIAVTAGSQ